MGRFSKLRMAAAALMVTAFGHSAQADGEPPRFQGFYGGLLGGYAAADEKWGTTGAPASANLSLDGGLGGLTLGYNWNVGNFLLGVEADGTALSMSDSNICSPMGARCNIDVDAMATVRARAGFFFGDENQVMLYATGGLAAVWLGFNNPGLAPAGSRDYTDVTYAVGGGVEGYVFGTDWLSTKLEYLFVGLDDTRTYTIGGAAAVNTARLSFDGIHAVRWGWNIHF